MAFLKVPEEYANKSTEEIVASAGTGGLPLIPPGKYHGIIVKSEFQKTQSGGEMLVLTNVITQGEHRDVEFIERLNLVNDNPVAVKIAFETLAKIAKAVGLSKIPTDSSELHNKPLLLTIKTEAGKPFKDKTTGEERMGKDKSVIGGYEALPKVGVAPMTAGVAQAGSALPWGKK